MMLIVVVVFALLIGFFITSLQSLESAPIANTPTLRQATSSPTATSAPAAVTSTPVPDESIWTQVQAARLFDQIAHQVETQRALSPQAEVPLSFLDDGTMAATLQDLYTKEDPESALLPFTALGLVPSVPISVQAHTPAGIYITAHQQLYVSTGRPQDDPDAQALLAHAYVHALQDQHFDLEAVRARAQSTDEKLAVQALIEGDATLVTALYGSEDLSSVDWSALAALIVQAEQPDYGESLSNHEAWSRLEQFPNSEGRAFAAALHEHGGWEALNSSYTDIPRSTEQILHPARYLGSDSPTGEPDRPTRVVVPDLDSVLSDEWGLLLEDTLGEFVVGLYLNRAMPAQAAWRAADGWDGDKFVVWEREDGQRIVVWRTIWSSSREASDYERGLSLLIPQRYYPVRPIDPPQGLSGRWWETSEGTVNVRRTARYVLSTHAPDTNTAVNVVKALP